MPKSSDISNRESNKSIARTITGLIFIILGLFLLISFVSFLFNGNLDQSQLYDIEDRSILTENIFGKAGALSGEYIIRQGVGVVAFFLPVFFIALGLKIITKIKRIKPFKFFAKSLFFLIWIPIFLGFIFTKQDFLYGAMGFEINDFLYSYIGKLGIGFLLLTTLLIYIILHWRITPEKIRTYLDSKMKDKEMNQDFEKVKDTEEISQNSGTEEEVQFSIEQTNSSDLNPIDTIPTEWEIEKNNKKSKTPEKPKIHELEIVSSPEPIVKFSEPETEGSEPDSEPEVSFTIEKSKEEVLVNPKDKAAELVHEFGEYDPTLDLPGFQFPPLNLLKKHDSNNQTIDQRELESNKNRIVETLGNYGIGITQIKATIGPTVTLYEIVPDVGVRISKIKNLEDDIALSLSALGIRIIAPIPGKGTIGIEVPNSNPSVVSMHAVLASQKFQTSTMDLPIAFGKTISNETFVADLAKMPHLLMAGATGQGKSVGLNAIITSLLYKKHPSELKFVLVDPKKVELTLYSKIERHYLAMLPNSEDAIITDNTKVIYTLNSLCIEMDERYDLLKNAHVRTLKEYNAKFRARKLNPENGHRYLPYIVLVVDEFADLIMTAGKEVELPIARLAQLARAIGIHLIIATQRPSVNVITGMIKANFPARVAFRVTTKIDSRTILDTAGADQLIGRGDMLFTTGNEIVRLQCAFVDTPEVDEITEFIGSQKGYPTALMLPEYEGEESSALDIDLNERDSLFNDAARLIVASQQGSASLLQRKMKLGYNRAGRLIDQLEAAGIVGPFEGSKARQVLIMDEMSLEQLLNNLP